MTEQQVDPKRALSEAVANVVKQGWAVESQDDRMAVLTRVTKTPGQAFARGGLIGMFFNERKFKHKRCIITVDDAGETAIDWAD